MDQAGARSTNVASTAGGFGTKSMRSASTYLTLRRGSGAGWSITSGKLESSSEASAGACGEMETSRACIVMLPLGRAAGPRVLAAKRHTPNGARPSLHEGEETEAAEQVIMSQGWPGS